MLSSPEGYPLKNPADALKISEMAATIKGISDPREMSSLLIDRYSYKKGAGWMGAEAIKIETIRAEQERGGK